LFRELGNKGTVCLSLHRLGQAALAQRKTGEAVRAFSECLQISQEVGRRSATADALAGLAGVMTAIDPERAVCLHIVARALRLEIGFRIPPSQQVLEDNQFNVAKEVLTTPALDAARKMAEQLTINEAVIYANQAGQRFAFD